VWPVLRLATLLLEITVKMSQGGFQRGGIEGVGVTMLIAGMLQKLICYGHLVVIDARGIAHEFKGKDGPRAVVRLSDRWIEIALIWHPELALCEGYMDGRILVEEGTICDVIDITLGSKERMKCGLLGRIWRKIGNAIGRSFQYNPAYRARRNVAHHYDLSSELYKTFLDDDSQYSCAYFVRPDDSLEEAQLEKKRHIAAKLRLRPGQRVLDIGSGWGGLGIYLAQVEDVDVTGITLSVEQYDSSMRRVRAGGLADRVRFMVQGYRACEGRFDRIVSVGMFEHVGVHHYDAYFRLIRDKLTDDGVALVHTIGVMTEPKPIAAFIRKYIFPGAHAPALSEITPAIERAGLIIADIEVWRMHYAQTLSLWRQRFTARRDTVVSLYDDRFFRMWEFYLASCEMFFRHSGGVVFQVQLANHIQSVPLTREYLSMEKQRLANAETQRYRVVA
jgi:cyclopropane-fatty-acyl-phospholipid synthase